MPSEMVVERKMECTFRWQKWHLVVVLVFLLLHQLHLLV